MRTALVEWSIGSPRTDSMINATQAFAARAFTAPKVPHGFCDVEDLAAAIAANPLHVTAAQLCEVLAQTLLGFRKLINWRTRLEPGRRLQDIPSDWWLTQTLSVRLCCRVRRVQPHAVLQVQQGPPSSACRGREELAGAMGPAH